MGRPRKFDEADVLLCAMTEFWRHGYAATTMRSLEAATGVGIRSLANTFGDKDQLFTEALARYRAMAAEVLDNVFDPPSAASVIAIFNGLSQATDPDDVTNSGCLMVNSVFEIEEPPEAVSAEIETYKAMWRNRFEAALVAEGVPDASSRADFLLSALWGALGQVRLAGSTTAARSTTDVIIQVVESWVADARS